MRWRALRDSARCGSLFRVPTLYVSTTYRASGSTAPSLSCKMRDPVPVPSPRLPRYLLIHVGGPLTEKGWGGGREILITKPKRPRCGISLLRVLVLFHVPLAPLLGVPSLGCFCKRSAPAKRFAPLLAKLFILREGPEPQQRLDAGDGKIGRFPKLAVSVGGCMSINTKC